MRRQISALKRLQELPEIFRGSDLTIRFQWTSKTASQTLYQWKQRGLVQSLGGHSDVYVNLLKNSSPDWGKAVLLAMPSAVTIGVEALRLSGWTTQIQHRPSVAVHAGHRIFRVTPFEIVRRNSRWFEKVRTAIEGDRASGLPTLRPAWALADLLHAQGWGQCGLWPDDIEWDRITSRDETDWKAACKTFGLPGQRTLADLQADPYAHDAAPDLRSHSCKTLNIENQMNFS